MSVAVAEKEIVRFPIAAGVFYPEDKEELLEYINKYDRYTERGDAYVILVPHGTWDLTCSLSCAAFSAAANRKISRVLILGSVHDKREDGLFLSSSSFFQTPLGAIPVDQDYSHAIESSGSLFEINDIPHLGEHSIEVLLPFVKFYFPETPIIPILMAQIKPEYIDDLASALEKVIAPVIDDTLIVVSCNLSKSSDKFLAKKNADDCIKLIAEKDWNAIYSSITGGGLSVCGGGPVISLLKSGLVKNSDCLSSGIVTATENNATVYYSSLYFK